MSPADAAASALPLLQLLDASGLLRPAGSLTEPEYVFRHALMQEVVYASLLKGDRRRLHLAIGQVLEAAGPERMDELAPILAWHFAEAGDHGRATRYYARAAQAAARVHAIREAIEFYSRALAALQSQSTSGQPDAAPEPAGVAAPAEHELYLARGRVHETAGEFEPARADQEAALAAAQRAGDRRGEWQGLVDLGALWAGRDYARTEEYYRQAYEIALDVGDDALIARSLNRTGNWQMNQGRFVEAIREHERALAIFEKLSDTYGIADTVDFLGITHILHGALDVGMAYTRQAIELFRAVDDRQRLASSLSTLTSGGVFLYYSALPVESTVPEALAGGQAALEISQQIGWRAGEAYALGVNAGLQSALGHPGEALRLARRGLELAVAIGHRQWTTSAYFNLGSIHLAILAPEDAVTLLRQALRLAGEIGSWLWVSQISGLLATALFQVGNLDEAEAILQDLAEDARTTRSLADLIIGAALGDLALARGDPERCLTVMDQFLTPIPGRPGLPVDDALTHRPAIALALLRGRAWLALKRPERAAEEMLPTRQAAVEHGFAGWSWQVDLVLAAALNRTARGDEAQALVAGARASVERMAQTIGDERLREGLLRGFGRRAADALAG